VEEVCGARRAAELARLRVQLAGLEQIDRPARDVDADERKGELLHAQSAQRRLHSDQVVCY
jgi:hypothetical protein